MTFYFLAQEESVCIKKQKIKSLNSMGCNLGESFFLTLTVAFTWKKLHVLVREGKDVDKVF